MSEKQSETTQSTKEESGYQVSSVLSEFLDAPDSQTTEKDSKRQIQFDKVPEEDESADDDEELEDQEAIIIKQKTQVEDALKASQMSFLKEAISAQKEGKSVEAIQPKIQRKLGGGLAAMLMKKRMDAAESAS